MIFVVLSTQGTQQIIRNLVHLMSEKKKNGVNGHRQKAKYLVAKQDM